MKAVVSTTYDDKYLFFLPLITWGWNKLGVEVVCCLPQHTLNNSDALKMDLVLSTKPVSENFREYFLAPENKRPTYSQVSRLFAAALPFQEDEIIVTSDIDMLVFKTPPHDEHAFTIFGADLTPEKQYPICYAAAPAKLWRKAMEIDGTFQECLDRELGHEEMENMRGNLWSRDQELLFRYTQPFNRILINRARPGTQFASNRYDRDDSFLLERLNPDTIDYHMNRPGYEEQNFNIIMSVLRYHYPSEDFTWLEDYRNQYIQLL